MLPLRTVVLEDEEDIRTLLLQKLAHFPELLVVGSAATADEAFQLLAQEKPAAAFMDIRLIGGDAFQLLSRLQGQGLPLPHIVLVTGFPQYAQTALNEYRRCVVQYVNKPFLDGWEEKFRRSIDALLAARLEAAAPAPSAGRITIQNRGLVLRFEVDKIAYLESAGGGETLIVTDVEVHQVDWTLNRLLELLPAARFQRISRTNVVNLNRITQVNREERTLQVIAGQRTKTLGIGEAFYPDLLKRLLHA